MKKIVFLTKTSCSTTYGHRPMYTLRDNEYAPFTSWITSFPIRNNCASLTSPSLWPTWLNFHDFQGSLSISFLSCRHVDPLPSHSKLPRIRRRNILGVGERKDRFSQCQYLSLLCYVVQFLFLPLCECSVRINRLSKGRRARRYLKSRELHPGEKSLCIVAKRGDSSVVLPIL